MKLKHKRKRHVLIDFVTARSQDECLAILQHEAAYKMSDWRQRLWIQSDASFSIDRLMSMGKYHIVEVRFEGTLNPVHDGTRIQGTITRASRRAIRWAQFWTFTLISVLVLADVLAWIFVKKLEIGCILTVPVAIVIIMSLSNIIWVRSQPVLLLQWIRQQLYIPID